MKPIQSIQNRAHSLKPWASIIIIALAALFIYTVSLSKTALLSYDEATYAQVVSETVQSGNIFTLKFNQKPWAEKPPLYIWAVIAVEKIIHPLSTIGAVDSNGSMHPTELTMRLPSALAGVLSIILIWLIVFEKTRNRKIASVASLILLSTGVFIDNARQAKLDVPVTAAILFTFYSYTKAINNNRWNIGIWLGLSFGIMIKSVIGLLIVPIIIFDLLVNNQTDEIKQKVTKFFFSKSTRIGLLLSSILIVPWHLYQTILYGFAFWQHYFFLHVLRRFETNLFTTDTSFFDFFGWFIWGALPWSIIFIIFLPLCFIPRFFIDKAHFRVFLSASLSSLFIFFIFAISRSKASSYLIPLYPFMAIAVVMGIEAIRYHYFKEQHAKHLMTLFTVTTCIFIILVAITNSIGTGFRKTETLQTPSVHAAEEKVIGLKTYSATSSIPIHYTTPDRWDTVRFYSGGRYISTFNRENIYSTEDYFIVATRENLARAINSPAVKFAADFKVEYLGEHFALIFVESNDSISTSTGL